MSAITDTEAEILTRVIGPDNPSFSPDAARSILRIGFADPDIARMNELAAKARNDALTEVEAKQLHGYLFVGAMIDLMHSKARLSLQKSDG
jgi:hypothetical protein